MKTKRSYDEALGVASRLVAWLEPVCDKVVIAGSIRRKRHMIGDIELVAIPTDILNMFGEPTGKTFLDTRLSNDPLGRTLTKNGPKYKQFTFDAYQVDLFLAKPDTFGYILMLRTGSAEFSHRMVTPVSMGGFRPQAVTVSEGNVFHHGTQVSVPDEETLFALWGMEVPKAQERDFIREVSAG